MFLPCCQYIKFPCFPLSTLSHYQPIDQPSLCSVYSWLYSWQNISQQNKFVAKYGRKVIRIFCDEERTEDRGIGHFSSWIIIKRCNFSHSLECTSYRFLSATIWRQVAFLLPSCSLLPQPMSSSLPERIQSHTGCNCLSFLHCVFSNVSSTCLAERRHSHTGCICLSSSPHCVFSNVSSNCLPERVQNNTGCTCLAFLHCVFLMFP